MPDKISVLRRAYEGFRFGDFQRGLEEFAEDIRWYMPAAEGLPASGSFHGRDEVRWMWGQIRSAYGEDMNARPVEFLESGDTVVVIGHLEGGQGERPFRVPYSTIWRFNDRGKPNRAMTLYDTATVRDALRAEQTSGDSDGF